MGHRLLGNLSRSVIGSLALFVAFGGTAYAATCPPSSSILRSPRAGSQEVQAKGMNDRGDVVGFADSRGGAGPIHAILWKGGKAKRAVDLGVLPGYVASEAYGVNNRRVVFGVLYDRQERTFPFRWAAGRMTVLLGPDGTRQQADVPDRNTVNERGEMAGTLLVAGQRQAVRWSADGQATLLQPLPGHTWTNAWSINRDGIVSGWSRSEPNDDGENNPVLWTPPATSSRCRLPPAAPTARPRRQPVRLDGRIPRQPGTDTDPERDNAVVWRRPRRRRAGCGAPARARLRGVVDVNERGQAAGMSGTFTRAASLSLGPRSGEAAGPACAALPSRPDREPTRS